MRFFLTVVMGAGLLLANWTAAVAEESVQQAGFEQRLEEWLSGMGADKIPDRQAPQQALQDALFQLGAAGRETELSAACKLIAAKLSPRTAKPARVWMLRQLECSGGAECVDSIAALLSDEDAEIRQCACRALQNNPSPEANVALLARVRSAVDDEQRLAIVNALGFRADSASVPMLSELLRRQDPAVARSAANSLARIGGAEAASALGAAMADAPQPLRAPMADACLRCAERLLKVGQHDRAAAAFRQLKRPDLPRAIRLAALQGELKAAGEKAVGIASAVLAGGDLDEQEIVAGFVADAFDAAAIGGLAKEPTKLSPSARILLLGALAAKGDKTNAPIAMAAAASNSENVRTTGIRALAKLGDASAVPLLVREMAAGGLTSEAARESLCSLFGDGVDGALLEAMGQAPVDLRGALIEVLDNRQAALAVPALLAEAPHKDAGIRTRAMRALGNLAEPSDVPAMVAILLKSEKGGQRDETEKAVTLVCNRIPEADNRADPVIAALGQTSNEERCLLLPLLGRIGGGKAAEEVQRAVQSQLPNLREAGVQALCNWPDASVADRLLELARQPGESQNTRALRAYIRVATLASDRPAKETLAMLKSAMEMAKRDDEKKLALSRAASVRDIATLRWLVPFLDDSALSAEACQAVIDLANRRELLEPNQSEFRSALEKVLAVSQDQRVKEEARQSMSGL